MGVAWFLLGFPPFDAFLINASMGKRYIYVKIKSNKKEQCFIEMYTKR